MENSEYGRSLLDFASEAVKTQSYSDQEGNFAELIADKMKELNFDDVTIDRAGNVIGRVGKGPTVIQFDSHMDTVEVNDADLWKVPPFEGRIADGSLWGRGSVDMKSALCASVYAAAAAKEQGLLEGKIGRASCRERV